MRGQVGPFHLHNAVQTQPTFKTSEREREKSGWVVVKKNQACKVFRNRSCAHVMPEAYVWAIHEHKFTGGVLPNNQGIFQ